jgi:hypothetical protein
MFGRLTRMFSGPANEASAEGGADAVPKEKAAKRSYGFATTKLTHYSDKNSEDLYRYKNLSSDYMRSSSPTHEEEEPAAIAGSGAFAIEKKDDDDKDNDNEENPSVSSKPADPSKK